MNTSLVLQKLLDDRKYWQGVADHFVEQASMDSQADFTFRLAQEKLLGIDGALKRIASDTIEPCDECGAQIEPARLEIIINSGFHVCARCANQSKAPRISQPRQQIRYAVNHQVVYAT